MHFSRDVFMHEEAPFEMPGGAVLSWMAGAGLEVEGWLFRDSSRLVTEESLSLQSSMASCSRSTAQLIGCLGVLRVLCSMVVEWLCGFVEGFDFLGKQTTIKHYL
jgi:hypothetical protein